MKGLHSLFIYQLSNQLNLLRSLGLAALCPGNSFYLPLELQSGALDANRAIVALRSGLRTGAARDRALLHYPHL